MLQGEKVRKGGREGGMREEKEKKVSVITHHHHHQHVCGAQFSFALLNDAPSPRWIGNILAHQRPGWAASRVELLTLQPPRWTRARMPIPKKVHEVY